MEDEAQSMSITRAISVMFVSGIDRLEKDKLSKDDFDLLVDLVEKIYPGDDRQKNFYQAIRNLSDKVLAARESFND